MDKNLDYSNTHQKGNWGEEKAVEYLLSLGYKIICRKYRSKRGEIDCIARDSEGVLVFIEVKSSLRKSFINPIFKINNSKQKTMFEMATLYLTEHNIKNTPCRFDVIIVTNDKIEHLKNAFIKM